MSKSLSDNEEAKLFEIANLLDKNVITSKVSNLKDSLNISSSFCSDRLGQLLEWFSSHYQSERKFNSHTKKNLFIRIFNALMKQRISTELDSEENTLRIIICLRIIMRDSKFQQRFLDNEDFSHFAEMFHQKSNSYLSCTEEAFVVDVVANLSSIFQKLSQHSKCQSLLLKNSIHETMLQLLNSTDIFILHCALSVLISLAESKALCKLIVDLHSIESILHIIQEFDDFSKCYAASLLRILSSKSEIKEQMMIYDSLPTLLSVLNDCEQCTLLWNVVWTLVRLCSDAEHVNEIRLLGGIPLLLNLLHKERSLTCRRYEISSGYARRGHASVNAANSTNDELIENKYKLHSACCAVLNELALDDRCSQTIVQSNGIYIIAKLIIPQKYHERCRGGALDLQKNAFRALRFLFAMERNRKIFKRLFPANIFQKFIDIGHYVRDIDAYTPLVELLNSMESSSIDEIQDEIEELNQNKTAKRHIRDYAIYDILGTGAFGSVYRVKKQSKQAPLALKEVSVAGGGGKNGKAVQKREIDEIVRELSIIREQLSHPNVVRYYSTFQENDKLYIEMELIEGASLQEHFTSLKEKHENGMGEERLWKVFIQMCLALRYLHCDKRIVHRDLTPNNVMVGENDKVTITDFGLAKQKKEASKMISVVGTILYSCPEIIKNEPYGEKADIWALGCILHQMATLNPPFDGSNMLSLAKRIVDAEYNAIPDNSGYSRLVNQTVKRCLTPEPCDRPDIVELSGMIADPLLRYTDNLATLHATAEKRVEKERRRTQKHFYEARKNKEDYQTLFHSSQENSERFKEFEGSSSGSSSSLKLSRTSTTSDTDVFTDNDELSNLSTNDNMTLAGKGSPIRPSVRTQPRPAGIKLPRSFDSDVTAARALNFDMKASRNNTADDSSRLPSHSSVPSDLNQTNISTQVRPASSGGSTARMLSISPSKLRQISDPVQQMLIQLHKIIYIDQLPPTGEVNYRRRIISRYKRALFSPHSRSTGLKDELKKLLYGSRETIDIIVEASSLTQKATAEAESRELLGDNLTSNVKDGKKSHEDGITYAQMQGIIERVLKESGYYDITNKPKSLYCDVMQRCRTVPEIHYHDK